MRTYVVIGKDIGKQRAEVALVVHGGALAAERTEVLDDWIFYHRRGFLAHAVAVQKSALEIDYKIAVEIHAHSVCVRNLGDDRCFHIFRMTEFFEFVYIVGVYNDRHAFLAFRYGKLGSRQPRVFFGHRAKLYVKSRRKLAHGNSNAARAEVVAALDEPREFAVLHEPLKLALYGRVALLHFRAARFYGMHIVRLGRTGSSAATVAPRLAAEQQHHVARLRRFAHNVVARRSAHNKPRFEAFCGVSFVVIFFDFARGKTYLVAVRRVTLSRALAYYALRELAAYCLVERRVDIRRARYAHRLINIRASRQRIAYSSAQTRRRAAERLYLRRVIVRFVFKEYVPRLYRSVAHNDVALYRARVYLGRNVLLSGVALRTQHLCAYRRNVHERRVFIVSALIH